MKREIYKNKEMQLQKVGYGLSIFADLMVVGLAIVVAVSVLA